MVLCCSSSTAVEVATMASHVTRRERRPRVGYRICYYEVTNSPTSTVVADFLRVILHLCLVDADEVGWAPGYSCNVVEEEAMEEEVVIDEEEAMSLMAEGLLVVEGEFDIQ